MPRMLAAGTSSSPAVGDERERLANDDVITVEAAAGRYSGASTSNVLPDHQAERPPADRICGAVCRRPRLISVAVPPHAREPAQHGTRTAALTWAGLRRSESRRARFGAARLAVAARTPGRHLRRPHLHDRRARLLCRASCASLRGEERNLDRLPSKYRVYCVSAACSRDRRESALPISSSGVASASAVAATVLPARQGRAGRRSGRAEYGLRQVE